MGFSVLVHGHAHSPPKHTQCTIRALYHTDSSLQRRTTMPTQLWCALW